MTGIDGTSNYHGYFIALPCDTRVISENTGTKHYKARIFNDNCVLITAPAYPYTFLNCHDQIERALIGTTPKNDTRANSENNDIMNAIRNATTYYDENQTKTSGNISQDGLESRKWVNYLCVFPEDHLLSSSVLNGPSFQEGQLKLRLIPIKQMHNRVGSCNDDYVGWRVARLDVKEFKKGRVDKAKYESEEADILMNYLANMNTSG